MKAHDWAAAVAVILIWAFNFIVGKVGVSEFPPLLMMAVRFSLVALLLIPFLRPHGKPWRLILALSTVFGLCHFGFLFVGLRGVGAGPAAIAIQLAVPFSSLLAAIFYAERLGPWQILGMLIAFSGVYLLAGSGDNTASVPHLLLIVIAAFAWAVGNILIKKIGPINVFTLNAWFGLLAAPQLLLASLLVESGQVDAIVGADWRGWGAIAYTAIFASIIAYGLWYYLIEKYAVNRIVPLTLMSPVLAVLLAAVILGEPLSLRVIVGGMITIAGVAMIQFLGRRLAEVPST